MNTNFSKDIAERVEAAGGKAYIVGGTVRDHFLNIESKDTDLLVTGLRFETLRDILPFKMDLVGQSFGVIKVTQDGETIDVALPRTERQIGLAHTDFDVQSDPNLPIEADLARRDFTMNAIAVRALTGDVVDPFGGIADIRAGVIRAVGLPVDRFSEDPLRMMRAVRFVAKTKFEIEETTFAAICARSEDIRRVSSERIQEELVRLLSYPDGHGVYTALHLFKKSGLLAIVIPEMAASIGFAQNNPYHDRTVLGHVFAAVEYAVEHGFSTRARVAAFFHDIGKPATYTCEDGCGHFYGHEDKGAEMTVEVMTRLKFSAQDIADISKIVREHLRPQNNNDKTLRRFVAEMGELTDDALACREADLAAHAPHVAATAKTTVDDFRARIATLPVHVKGFDEASLALRGDVIAKTFQVKGRDIGKMKKALAKCVVDGLVTNEAEALIAFVQAGNLPAENTEA